MSDIDWTTSSNANMYATLNNDTQLGAPNMYFVKESTNMHF